MRTTDARAMRRVMIIGQPGSGKSTLACAVGEIAHLPVYYMDRLQWEAGWQMASEALRTERALAVHRMPAWVFEGSHSATWPDRLAHADTLVWLDLPVGLRLWRVSKRIVRWAGRDRPDVAPGCPERFNADFYRYIWRTRRTGRARCETLYDSAQGRAAAYRLRSPRQVAQWLGGLRDAAAVGNLGISHR